MSAYIPRIISDKIKESQKYFPVAVITGPRQSGKTSLCRHLFPDFKYVNLEDLSVRGFASSDPVGFIDSLGDKAVIDEVQNVPGILSMIQVRVDEKPGRRFVLTGSSNFSLLEKLSQSLAGRAAVFTVLPFSLREVPPAWLSQTTDALMFRGEYPGVVANGIPAPLFYRNYYNTYVERDVRDLLRVSNLLRFDKFMRLLAARCGSEFNASALAKEVGVSSRTISEWLSILSASYIAYTVAPYFANISKRLTKMPKVYFYDTGLVCYLLGIEDASQLDRGMYRGAVFENLAMGELLKGRLNTGADPCLNFYREYSGKEVDAMVSSGGGINLYEIKAGRTFKEEFLANMEYVKSVLPNVRRTSVIYDGESMGENILNIRQI